MPFRGPRSHGDNVWTSKGDRNSNVLAAFDRKPQAVYGSVTIAVPEYINSSKLVSHFRAVDAMMKKAAMPMPNPEAPAMLFAGTHAFFKLDMLRGYWQMPLSQEAQLLFTTARCGGLCMPRRVMQIVLNMTVYLQGVMRDMLDGLLMRNLLDMDECRNFTESDGGASDQPVRDEAGKPR